MELFARVDAQLVVERDGEVLRLEQRFRDAEEHSRHAGGLFRGGAQFLGEPLNELRAGLGGRGP